MSRELPGQLATIFNPRSAPFQALALAAGTFLIVSILGIALGPSKITGDESEYYAMTSALATHGSPTLTPDVVKTISTAFPRWPPATMKAVDGSSDALHFWFLSALASPFFLLCNAIGLDWKHCFVFVNALALAGAAGVTAFYFRWQGAALLLIGLSASPLFPYLNKAHGEAFSVSLLAVAAVFLTQGRMLAAALALSIVSAQVTAFSPIAGILLLYWASRRRPTRTELAIVAVCIGLLVLQPLWTLWRHHTLNLLVAAGYVKPALINLTRVSGMLIDPDIGLLFSWPLGPVLALLTIIGLWRNRELIGKHAAYWIFAIGTTVFLSLVGATQTNYTHSIPRYSFWFVPFFLISLILIYERERTKATPHFARAIAVVCIAGSAAVFGYGAVVTGFQSNFRRHPQAELWYRLFPAAYDPDQQAFADITLGEQHSYSYELSLTGRYPINELPDHGIWALSNKACTKLLVFAYAFTSSNVQARLPFGCSEPLDPAQLLSYVRRERGSGMRDRYVNIAHADLNRMKLPKFPPAPPAPASRGPRVESTNVSARTASQVTYSLSVADADGWQDLDSVFLSISVGASTCQLVYNQPTHVLALAKNGRAIVGEPGALRGEHCSLNPREVTVSAAGDALTLTVPVTLDPALAAPEPQVQTGVIDFARARAGWTEAAHLFPPPRNTPPSDLTFSTKRVDQGEDVNVAVDAGNDFGRIAHLWIVINDRMDTNNACYVGLDPIAGRIYLVPDDTRGKALEMRLGRDGFLENSQCAIDGARSTLSVNRDRLELGLRVLRKTSFSSRKRIWVGYQDEAGKLQTWREIGAM